MPCRHDTTLTLQKNNAADDLEHTSHFCPMSSCLIKTLLHDMRLAIGNKLTTKYTHDLTNEKKGTAHCGTRSRSNKLLFANLNKPYPRCHSEPSVCSFIPISVLAECELRVPENLRSRVLVKLISCANHRKRCCNALR